MTLVFLLRPIIFFFLASAFSLLHAAEWTGQVEDLDRRRDALYSQMRPDFTIRPLSDKVSTLVGTHVDCNRSATLEERHIAYKGIMRTVIMHKGVGFFDHKYFLNPSVVTDERYYGHLAAVFVVHSASQILENLFSLDQLSKRRGDEIEKRIATLISEVAADKKHFLWEMARDYSLGIMAEKITSILSQYVELTYRLILTDQFISWYLNVKAGYSVLLRGQLPLRQSRMQILAELANLTNLHDRAPNLIWPGFRISEKPTIVQFYDEEEDEKKRRSQFFAFDLKDPKAPWKRGGDSTIKRPYWQSDENPWDLPLYTSMFPFDGQEVFLFTVPPMGSHFAAGENFLRMRFNYYKTQGRKEYDRRSFSDYRKADVINFMFLEYLCLQDWLLSDHGNLLHLRNYIVVYNLRKQMRTPEEAHFEDVLAKTEGLFSYVALSSQIALDPKNAKTTFLKFVEEQVRCSTSSDSWSYAYTKHHIFVGAVLGFALDFLQDEGWKDKIQGDEDGKINFVELLSESLKSNEAQKSIEEIRASYSDVYSTFSHLVATGLHIWNQRIGRVNRQFREQEGVEIILWGVTTIDCNCDTSVEEDHSRTIWYNTTGSFRSTEGTNDLKVKKLPFLFHESVSVGPFEGRGFRFKINGEMVLLDEKPFDLRKFTGESSLSFKKLSWKDTYSEYICERPGVIAKKGKAFLINSDKSTLSFMENPSS